MYNIARHDFVLSANQESHIDAGSHLPLRDSQDWSDIHRQKSGNGLKK